MLGGKLIFHTVKILHLSLHKIVVNKFYLFLEFHHLSLLPPWYHFDFHIDRNKFLSHIYKVWGYVLFYLMPQHWHSSELRCCCIRNKEFYVMNEKFRRTENIRSLKHNWKSDCKKICGEWKTNERRKEKLILIRFNK